MKYILLDTNIYLHCHMFDAIPWQSVIGDGDSFRILLPMQVLRELEKEKDRGQGAVRKRAKDVCSKLGSILLEEEETGVELVTCEQPDSKEFVAGFSPEIADDVILMSGVAYAKDCLEALLVISRDIPLLLKAKQAGIRFMRIPEEYVLSGEPIDKEKMRIAEELRQLKNRMSKPRLAFNDGSNVIRMKRVPERVPEIDVNLPEEEREHIRLRQLQDISKERYRSVCINIFNEGTAQTGELSIHLKPKGLKTAIIDVDVEHVPLPAYLMSDEEKCRDWGFCEPYRMYTVYVKNEDKIEDDVRECEIDPVTQGMNRWVAEYCFDMAEAVSGSIDWVIYDPALPEPVKGTLSVVIEN